MITRISLDLRSLSAVHSGVVILGSNCLAIATQIHLGDHDAANEAGHP